jgi:hypothetical protein
MAAVPGPAQSRTYPRVELGPGSCTRQSWATAETPFCSSNQRGHSTGNSGGGADLDLPSFTTKAFAWGYRRLSFAHPLSSSSLFITMVNRRGSLITRVAV